MEIICKNCKHCELMFSKQEDRYCMNSQCDIEFSSDKDCDNYMGIVEDNETCKLFE
jgi:hypothetical protein